MPNLRSTAQNPTSKRHGGAVLKALEAGEQGMPIQIQAGDPQQLSLGQTIHKDFRVVSHPLWSAGCSTSNTRRSLRLWKSITFTDAP